MLIGACGFQTWDGLAAHISSPRWAVGGLAVSLPLLLHPTVHYAFAFADSDMNVLSLSKHYACIYTVMHAFLCGMVGYDNWQ